MKRRYFVMVTSLYSITVLLNLARCGNKKQDFIRICSNPIHLRKFLKDKDIKNLGMLYFNGISNRNENKFITDFLSKISLNDISLESDKETVLTSIKNEISNDFETNNTFEYEGWILSITEVEQASLYYLINLV